MSYLVRAPLVIAADSNGVLHHQYAGEVIAQLDAATAKRLVADGMVVELGTAPIVVPAELATESAAPVEVPAAAVAVGPDEKPKHTALKDVWVDFAVSRGIKRHEAEAMSKQELIELTS